jgi:hypothetical protein
MMNMLVKENEIKLHLLESLAMSQRAVSAILGSCAELSEQSPELSRQLLQNLEHITRYQGVLTEKISGVRIRRLTSGCPRTPWWNRQMPIFVKSTHG